MKNVTTTKTSRNGMIGEVKDVFTTKKGILIILAMITLAISAYLNLITVKSFMIGDFGISFGTVLLSFLPMITSEIMAECFGWKKGFIISSIAYTICLIFTLIMWGSTLLPGLVFVGNDLDFATDAYNLLFASTPVVLIASAVAYYIGIFFNCFIMGKLKEVAEKKGDNNWKLFGRFALSTGVGQTLDNAIFFLIPMFFGLWDFTYVWQQTVAAFVIEILYEILFFAVTAYLVRKINNMPEGLSIVVNAETKEVEQVIS